MFSVSFSIMCKFSYTKRAARSGFVVQKKTAKAVCLSFTDGPHERRAYTLLKSVASKSGSSGNKRIREAHRNDGAPNAQKPALVALKRSSELVRAGLRRACTFTRCQLSG